MSKEYFLIIFFIVNILLIIFFKFTKLLLDNPTHGKHKNEFYRGIPLTGGCYFLICSVLIFFSEENSIIYMPYFIFFSLVFILGIFSDTYKNMSPMLRLIIHVAIVVGAVCILKINVDKTSLNLLDFLISNRYINIFFTSFCLLVLLNGSNFCDGINLNVIGYYLIVFIALNFLDINNSDADILILIISCLLIFYITNFLNFSFLGDNGVYVLSLFSGIYVINFINSEQYLNPLIALNLLWYPAYENLFSIISRKIKRNKIDHADTKHLDFLVKNYLSKKINILTDLNSLTGLIFNLFNFISIGAAVLYRNNSYILLLILIINLIIYNFIYFKLKDNNL